MDPQVWSQVYDPLGNIWLSTTCSLRSRSSSCWAPSASSRSRRTWRPCSASRARLLIAIVGFGMPARHGRHGGRLRRRLTACCRSAGSSSTSSSSTSSPTRRASSTILQRSITHDHRRPPPAAAAHRLLLRRLLRRRGRLRHAGRRHRRDADRPGLLAAGGLGPVADRQYRPGRLRRARHADHRAGRRHRPRPAASSARMIGRQLPFFSLHRAVLADLGLRRLPQACSRSGRRSWSPASRSRSRNIWSRTSTAPGWSTSSRRSCRWSAWPCSCGSGSRRELMTATPRDWRRTADRRRARTSIEADGHARARRVMQGLDALADPVACSCSSGALPQVKALLDGICASPSCRSPACTTWS